MPGNGKHWLLYDGNCRFCLGMVKRWRGTLESRGFAFASLHEEWVGERLGLAGPELLSEMRVLCGSGRVLGGVEAFVFLWSKVWWCWPLWLLALLPGVRRVMGMIYRRVAAKRYCVNGSCSVHAAPGGYGVGWAAGSWLPLVTLTSLVFIFRERLPEPWVFMWVLAFALFFGCKWLTLWRAWHRGGAVGLRGALGYLFFWPGMDVGPFMDDASPAGRPAAKEWLAPVLKTALGAVVLWWVTPLAAESPLTAGWCGMAGLILILHFGVFHLLALVWRCAGISAEPIMNSPATATSLSLFWAERWNRGFNELVHVFLFRPTYRKIGVAGAMFLVFFASGLIHDLVISVPARACYGLPTVYFLLQGFGVLLERTAPARRLGLNRGIAGWLYMAVFTLGPAPWLLFPPAFVTRVMNPFFEVIGAL